MEDIVKNLKHCFTLKFDNVELISYMVNETHDHVIEVSPLVKFPHVIYNKVNYTHYQWCGPMFVIVKYLSKFTKCKYDNVQLINSLAEKFINFLIVSR